MTGIYLMIPVAVGIFGVVVASFLIAGRKAQDGIRAYVAGRGGKLIDASWGPTDGGLLPEKGTRFYRVRYVDPDGNEHEARCKANLWTGVQFTQDKIVRLAPPADKS